MYVAYISGSMDDGFVHSVPNSYTFTREDMYTYSCYPNAVNAGAAAEKWLKSLNKWSDRAVVIIMQRV